MTDSLFDDLCDVVNIRMDEEKIPAVIQRFAEASIYVPAETPGENGRARIRMVSADDGKTATLPASFDQAYTQENFEMPGGKTEKTNGRELLYNAQGATFGVLLEEAKDKDLYLTHEHLILFQTILSVADTEGNASSTPDLTAAGESVPTAFMRWLQGYCRQHRDISKAWLGLVQMSRASNPDVAVVLNTSAFSAHDARIREKKDLLFPSQLLHIERMNGKGTGAFIWRKFSEFEPFYDATLSQSWWARLCLRFRRPPPTPVLQIEVAEDKETSSGAS